MGSTGNKFLGFATAFLIFSTLIQGFAIFGVVAIEPIPHAVFTTEPWLIPMWCVMLGVLPVAAILCRIFRERGKWLTLPLCVAAVGTIMALVVALTLYAWLKPETYLGVEYGLTFWKLCYRHLTSVVAGLLTVAACIAYMVECRAARIRRENDAYKSIYNLEGDPLFRDTDSSTLGLEREEEPRRLKRSQRRAIEKRQEQQEKRAQRKPKGKK